MSVHLLNRELVKLGNEVVVYTTTFGLAQNETQENIIYGVKVIYLKSFKLGKWLVPIFLRKKLSETKNYFDITHIQQIWDPICWLSELFFIKNKTPFIITPRGSIDPVLIKKKSYFIKKILYALFVKRIFKNASGFHFTSEYEKEQFVKFSRINTNTYTNKHKCRIIFNPLDISEFQKNIDKNLLQKWNLKNKRYFLYLGRINSKK